ncbi:MAG: hypothetical protein SGILL_006685, partial [Bacillariaceae sp.]
MTASNLPLFVSSSPGDNQYAKAPRDAAALSQDIERILSTEMQSLSFKDRMAIQEEVHGVANMCPEETPQMMQEALCTMQKHINSMKHKP